MSNSVRTRARPFAAGADGKLSKVGLKFYHAVGDDQMPTETCLIWAFPR
jgi:hypothetical protein